MITWYNSGYLQNTHVISTLQASLKTMDQQTLEIDKVSATHNNIHTHPYEHTHTNLIPISILEDHGPTNS